MVGRFKYLAGILLPEPWHTRIWDIWKNHKTDEWNIPLDPHITLLPPSRAILGVGEAQLVLEGVAQSFKPFEILVDGMGKFLNGSFTIFAEVRDTHELSRLNHEIIKASQEFADVNLAQLESRGFHPHITLSNRLGNRETQEKVFRDIEQEWTPFSFVCDGVSLFIKYPEEKRWKEIQKILF